MQIFYIYTWGVDTYRQPLAMALFIPTVVSHYLLTIKEDAIKSINIFFRSSKLIRINIFIQ